MRVVVACGFSVENIQSVLGLGVYVVSCLSVFKLEMLREFSCLRKKNCSIEIVRNVKLNCWQIKRIIRKYRNWSPLFWLKSTSVVEAHA